jgi:Fe-S cluster assembly iron-binding protein IscA
MIGVTERAKQELKGILQAGNFSESGSCVRLSANQDGKLGLGIDVEKPDDKAIDDEGLKLLVVEQHLADSLENLAIDIVDSEKGKQFVIVKIPETPAS